MAGIKLIGMSGLAWIALWLSVPQNQTRQQNVDALIKEATIESIHSALRKNEITCRELVGAYLERIRMFDHEGPALNSILSVNPNALQLAAEADRVGSAAISSKPLHCIPVILKDNYNTADMPTTGGSRTFAKSLPPVDAFVVKRLREAGAIILAKANLTELARGGTTVSSLGGQTRNPYDLTRTPGGSSGGTSAAIAANFGVLGTGSDTGQSIRSPASALSLVGIRATRGLVSRAGIIPYSSTQDEAGPITRTVEDAARMLDVMAGYDPADPITAFSIGKVPRTYSAFLDKDGLRGARIGLLVDFLGTDAVHQPVNVVVDSALRHFERLGATVVRIRIPNLQGLTQDLNLLPFEFRPAFEKYLASLGPSAPVKTLDQFIARGEFHESLRAGLEADARVVDGLNRPEYKELLLRRDRLRQAVMTAFAENNLNAMLYPHQKRLVCRIGEEQLERNGVLSNSTGFPAITFPGGFSDPSASAPMGVPVGLEFIGPEWSEGTLIKLAYAFQDGTRIRRPPASTPFRTQ